MKICFAIVVLVLANSVCAVAAENGGKFLDDLILRDVGNDRDFELVNKFRYLDPERTTWIVPRGEVVNGASIPSFLWSFIGGPWSGNYRRASVVHDYFFGQKKYDSESVHRVFYDAMVTSGVVSWKAKSMWYAVWRFNDAWEETISIDPCIAGDMGGLNNIRCYPVLAGEESQEITYTRVSVDFVKDDLDSAVSLIKESDLSLQEIKDLAKARKAQAHD